MCRSRPRVRPLANIFYSLSVERLEQRAFERRRVLLRRSNLVRLRFPIASVSNGGVLFLLASCCTTTKTAKRCSFCPQYVKFVVVGATTTADCGRVRDAQELEDELSLEDIIFFRAMAEREEGLRSDRGRKNGGNRWGIGGWVSRGDT